MPVRTAACVWQAADVTGTGAATLGTAVTGYRSVATAIQAGDLADGDTVPYRIEAVDPSGAPSGDWEVGEGTISGAGATLNRTRVLASSNAGAPVVFGTGSKLALLTEPDSPYLVLPFQWNNATTRAVGFVPAGSTVSSVRLMIVTAFTDPASTLQVGTLALPAVLMDAGMSDPTQAADYEVSPLIDYAVETIVYLTITAGPSESSGAGILVVEYEPSPGS